MWVGSGADTFSERRFQDRVRFISILFAVGYVVITLRLFHLQVVRGEDLAHASESNRTQVIFLRAPRGDFYDRQGRVMVTNRPSWSLMYSVPKDSPLPIASVEERLRPYLENLPKYWVKRLQSAYQTKRMVRLAEDVPEQTAFAIREMGELVPGLRVAMEFRRGYPLGVYAAHLIGYLGEVSEKELREESDVPKKPGDLIGKMGLEKILDDRLRGQDGGMLIEVDSLGKLKRIIRELPYEKGGAAHLTLDLDIQRVAEEALSQTKTKRGAILVTDVNTGAVLAWASAPSFDPLGSLASDIYDPHAPFLDRVYKGTYPPGSVFKVITAIAAFENDLIRTSERVECIGYVTLPDKRATEKKFRCWKVHGYVDYWRAMAESCDTYFYTLGKRVNSQWMADQAFSFGMGQTIQKELPKESIGVVPSPQWKRKNRYGGWSLGDTFNMTIGQGFITATPLQMTALMMGIATRGSIYRPYSVDKILNAQGMVVQKNAPSLWRSIQLKESTWNALTESMRKVVTQGTGIGCHIPYLDVRGKTGTAQNPQGEDHAWFTAYAGYPDEKPAVAIAVFVENGGSGGSVAAPIAKKVLEATLPSRENKQAI